MTTEDFKKIYTVFSEITDFEIQYYFDFFESLYENYSFSKARDFAKGLFTAHCLALKKTSLDDVAISGKHITSQKTPEFQVDFTNPAETLISGQNLDMFYRQTHYGLSFLNVLQSKCSIGALA